MKKLLNLENLIYLTILALPSYLLKVTIFGLPSNILELLMGVCIVFWLVFHANNVSWSLFFKKFRHLILAVGLIFFGLISSMLVNKSYVISAGIIKAWFFLPLIFSVVSSSIINRNKRRNLFYAYYASAFFVALISLAYYALNQITYDGRLSGIFNSPNYLAMYLAPAIFIGHYTILPGSAWRSRWILFVSLMIMLGVIYLTYSYGTWIALALSFMITLGLEKRFFSKHVFMVFLLMLFLFFSQYGKHKLVDLTSFSARSSASSRIMIWHSAGKILEDNLFWGIGAGNFQTRYLEYQKYFPPYLEWAVPHPHSLYLAFWLYSGLIGLIGFLLLIILWLRAIFEKQKNDTLKLMGVAIMGYILLCGFVDTTYFKNDLAVIFWLLFTLL